MEKRKDYEVCNKFSISFPFFCSGNHVHLFQITWVFKDYIRITVCCGCSDAWKWGVSKHGEFNSATWAALSAVWKDPEFPRKFAQTY